MCEVKGVRLEIILLLSDFLKLVSNSAGLDVVRHLIADINAAGVEFKSEGIELFGINSTISIVAYKDADRGTIKAYVMALEDGHPTEMNILDEKLRMFREGDIKIFFSRFNQDNCIKHYRKEYF